MANHMDFIPWENIFHSFSLSDYSTSWPWSLDAILIGEVCTLNVAPGIGKISTLYHVYPFGYIGQIISYLSSMVITTCVTW